MYTTFIAIGKHERMKRQRPTSSHRKVTRSDLKHPSARRLTPSVVNALSILGLSPGATPADVVKKHHRIYTDPNTPANRLAYIDAALDHLVTRGLAWFY